MRGMKHLLTLAMCFCLLPATSAQAAENTKAETVQDSGFDNGLETTSVEKTITVAGKEVAFTASVERVPLYAEGGKLQARMHAFTYKVNTNNDDALRPITFLFNGGPGSSSVWLHLGAFGPYRVGLDEQGVAVGPPYSLNENPNTLLPTTDLVFIDPITTGHSRAAEGIDAQKTFRSVSGDINSIAQFIYRYLTLHKAWDRPIYIGGESYGTTRAAGLTKVLQDKYGIYPAGVILVSAVLDFSTIHYGPMNDSAFVGIYPTYALLAHHHNKTNNQTSLNEVRNFAENAITNAVWLSFMPKNEYSSNSPDENALSLGNHIGIDEQLLKQTHLRLHPSRFRSELLKDEGRVLGRFDGRYTLPDTEPANPWPNVDPSYNLVHGAFTAGIHQLLADIGYETNETYEILKWGKWDFESEGKPLETASRLASAMNVNPNLKVYVASGIYDLATPYYAARMTIDRYFTEPDARGRFTFVDYEAGHMMFVHKPSQEKLVQSITEWMTGE